MSDDLKLVPLTPAERRARYECELCAGGPDKRRSLAAYWAAFDDSRRITICAKHATDIREAQSAIES